MVTLETAGLLIVWVLVVGLVSKYVSEKIGNYILIFGLIGAIAYMAF